MNDRVMAASQAASAPGQSRAIPPIACFPLETGAQILLSDPKKSRHSGHGDFVRRRLDARVDIDGIISELPDDGMPSNAICASELPQHPDDRLVRIEPLRIEHVPHARRQPGGVEGEDRQHRSCSRDCDRCLLLSFLERIPGASGHRVPESAGGIGSKIWNAIYRRPATTSGSPSRPCSRWSSPLSPCASTTLLNAVLPPVPVRRLPVRRSALLARPLARPGQHLVPPPSGTARGGHVPAPHCPQNLWRAAPIPPGRVPSSAACRRHLAGVVACRTGPASAASRRRDPPTRSVPALYSRRTDRAPRGPRP